MGNDMVVVYEFFGKEPIENVITSMHFKVDKVVYFGYHNALQDRREYTKNFLTKYCKVETVVFHELSGKDLQSVLKTMRREIQNERGNGSKVYFDITGGESLILVAFGMLSREFESPMHMYDVPSDKLIELDDGAMASISKDVAPQKVELTVELFVEMNGGGINWYLHKNTKDDDDDEFVADISKIWMVAKKYNDYWNPFSQFLQEHMVSGEGLQVSENVKTVLEALGASNNKLKNVKKLNSIVDDLAAEKILLDVRHTNGEYCFRFKNQSIKDCLCDCGRILELHTFLEEKKNSDHCMVGVHLDWDGVIHPQTGEDVLNEIDVLSISGNVPTFISCKNGRMENRETLNALYELDTVAKRIGGKYAKKVLVSRQKLEDVYLLRAEEMGIEVRGENFNESRDRS